LRAFWQDRPQSSALKHKSVTNVTSEVIESSVQEATAQSIMNDELATIEMIDPNSLRDDREASIAQAMDKHAEPSQKSSQDHISHPYACTTAEPVELIRIFHPLIQVARWRRQADPGIEAYLQQRLVNSHLTNGFRTVIRAGQSLKLDFFPDLPGKRAMAQDISLIADIYSELLGCDEIALRLEAPSKAMCPRFHVDRTGIRLICTYRGQGTEWIDDRWVDRSKLGQGSLGLADDASGLFDARTTVEAAAPFDVLLLKGSLWQENIGRGAIHRSPSVIAGSGSRILLVMDAIWTG
jgi:hypothetical protein